MLSKNRSGSAMIIALIILILLTIMSTVFIEKLWRFNIASEGIENSNIAYYLAIGLTEETLAGKNAAPNPVDKYHPWNVAPTTNENYTNTGRIMNVFTGSNTVPAPGKWNSPYDTNYNIIALGDPVQLVIPDGITNLSNIKLEFRVATISGSTNNVTDPIYANSGAILWTFASSGSSLFASGETNIFRMSEINTPGGANIDDKNGVTNSWSPSSFGSFYTLHAPNCVNYACTLKLSLLRPVPLTDGRSMSFLEYKITGLNVSIPSQYMTLESRAYSNGFLRSRTIQFPQITTNTALDFAVLQ